MKTFFDYAWTLISWLALVIGILGIIGAFVESDKGSMERFMYGITGIVFSVFSFGFSYLVDAAYIYIQKNEDKE